MWGRGGGGCDGDLDGEMMLSTMTVTLWRVDAIDNGDDFSNDDDLVGGMT